MACALVSFSAPALADDPPKPQARETKLAPEFEVTSDTAAQFYDVRSPTGATILSRRRLTTTLGASVYDLWPRPKEGTGQQLLPDLTFRTRLRYDADYGADAAEADPRVIDRFVPGFSRGQIDLMYAYVEGRRFLKGLLGFRLGRQYMVDPLGWWSFDGGLVKLTTPFFVAAEVYGGLEVRGGFPLAPTVDRWSRGGIWRGDRSGVDPNFWPSYQPVDVAPAFGFAIESTGVQWLHSRLTYRRVHNTGASNASQFGSGLYNDVSFQGSRISQERIGYSLSANHPKIGGVQGGFNYDFYSNRFPSIYGSAEVFVGPKVIAGLDYDFYQPAFDGDSIWNFFASQPTHTMALRGNLEATDKLSFAGSGFVRAFTQQTQNEMAPFCTGANATPQPCTTVGIGGVVPPGMQEYYPTNSAVFFGGGNLAARYHTPSLTAGLRGNGQFGDGGRRVGADIFGEKVFDGRYVGTLRLGTWSWKDDLRPTQEATNFQYVVGLGYRFFGKSQAMIEWQHDMNRIAGQRFRLMLWLTLAVLR